MAPSNVTVSARAVSLGPAIRKRSRRQGIQATTFQRVAASSSRRPADIPELRLAAATATLESNCALGIPVVCGVPIANDRTAMDLAILNSIHANDYNFIRDAIMRGWSPDGERCASFTLKLTADGVEKVWEFQDATPLQYALSCGSFESAAAFLIAFPSQAELRCTAHNPDGEEVQWDALHLTIFLSNFFLHRDLERAHAYVHSSLLLVRVRENASDVAFLGGSTPSARLEAAGDHSHAVLAALLASQGNDLTPASDVASCAQSQ